MAVGAGALFSLGLTGQPNSVGGEGSLWVASRWWRTGAGIDAAWTARRLYSELQVAHEIVGGHDWGVVTGLGVGPTLDRDAIDHRWGVQVTAWTFAAFEFPIPIVPFVRVEYFPDREATLACGLMLKIIVPAFAVGRPGT